MIENERKYVLQPDDALIYFAKISRIYNAKIKTINQGYLDVEGKSRIRSIDGLIHKRYYYTFKDMVGSELMEIEQQISEEDFNLLWGNVNRVINKKRVTIPMGHNVWEVDFFDSPTGIYFVMAECEMDRYQVTPDVIPPFINDELLYTVERDDLRFTNCKLSDRTYVKQVLEDLNGKSKFTQSNT